MLKIILIWLLIGICCDIIMIGSNYIFYAVYTRNHKEQDFLLIFLTLLFYEYYIFENIIDIFTFKNKGVNQYIDNSIDNVKYSVNNIKDHITKRDKESTNNIIIYAFIQLLVWPIALISYVLAIVETYLFFKSQGE